ncbi:1626_t:CDS:2 [Ambispora gerdemannii]|uniref:1626_t:CDS:1 n=1 Tax=Ambispora gerdemannii TaxID=144530 RepID=A0A9N8Z802_9GLOM|nr:1626_t:CDS:2 [Ambispora gerdemannii]
MVLPQSSGTLQDRKNKKPNEIDTTGRRYIFTVRGTSYPQLRRLNNAKQSTNCKYCDKNSQYIDILEARLDDIDNVIDDLAEIVSKNNNSSDSNMDGLDLSTIDIQNLLMISNNIGLGLYDKS